MNGRALQQAHDRAQRLRDTQKGASMYDQVINRVVRESQGLNVGARVYPRYTIGGPVTELGTRVGADTGVRSSCAQDPTAPSQGGICVCGPNECEYDPAIFCGWNYIPFSTYKDQGDAPLVGPVAANFGALREIRMTAERACMFRVRGIWMRSVEADACATIGMSLLANITINRVPRPIEIGSIAVSERIGLPTSLFDDTFWVMPVNWGILLPIQNNSLPMFLSFMSPCSEQQHVVGVAFGDAISSSGRPEQWPGGPAGSNYMMVM